ncbi:MAG: hypothetical protein ACRDMJ_08180 [Solirubrobacteraceae bacterium]
MIALDLVDPDLLPDEVAIASITRRRAIDLLIAATALAVDPPVYTANPAGFSGLEDLIAITPLRTR